MYAKHRTVLLDVDADFMLDDDYYDCTPRPEGERVGRDKQGRKVIIDANGIEGPRLLITGQQMGKVLRRFIWSGTKVYLIVDHHEALYWWDQHDVHNAVCIHIDAHHDMWNREEWQGCRLQKKGRRDSIIDCGNYLHQAAVDGIVGKILYVPVSWKTHATERADIHRQFGQEKRRVGIRCRSWQGLVSLEPELPHADVITVAISPEWFPYKFMSEVEDLAKELGVPGKQVQEALIEANKRYVGVGVEFEFPHKPPSLYWSEA